MDQIFKQVLTILFRIFFFFKICPFQFNFSFFLLGKFLSSQNKKKRWRHHARGRALHLPGLEVSLLYFFSSKFWGSCPTSPCRRPFRPLWRQGSWLGCRDRLTHLQKRENVRRQIMLQLRINNAVFEIRVLSIFFAWMYFLALK